MDQNNDAEMEDIVRSSAGSKGLIYWRLGKVEKAVETFNESAQRRDDVILTKLEAVGSLSDKINENSFKIQSLERTRDLTNKVIVGLVVAIGAVIADAFFNLV